MLPIAKGETTIQQMMERRSIRRYQERPIPEEKLQDILIAATWAPSAHNRQPWRFAVVRLPETKQMLAKAMGDRLRQDLSVDGLPSRVIEADVNRSYQRITGAPTLILVCLSLVDMDEYPDPRRRENERIMAVQSTAMAGQNLLLAAHSLGLAACWMCAPLFCPDTVRQTLDLPVDWLPQGLVSVGYAAEEKVKSRRPLESCIRFVD
jgi:F420 biosynthesis protein FbiB-like protein